MVDVLERLGFVVGPCDLGSTLLHEAVARSESASVAVKQTGRLR
jgi:hypothetical protein